MGGYLDLDRGSRRWLACVALALCVIALAAQCGCGSSSAAVQTSAASASPSLKPWQTPQEELQAFLEAQRPRMEADAAGYKALAAAFSALDAGDLKDAARGFRQAGSSYGESASLMDAMSPPQEFSDLTRVADTQARYADSLIDLSEFLDDFKNGDRFIRLESARGNALLAEFDRSGRPWDLAANDYQMQLHIALQDRHLTYPDWMARLTADMWEHVPSPE